MKISIRIKFFVVLLAFSLGPIFLSRMIMGKAVTRMADDVSARTRSELNEIVSADLEANANMLLELTTRGGTSMEFGVALLAQQAGHALDGHVAGYKAKPYYTFDFANPDDAPPDTTAVEGYERQTMSGKTRPLKVSMSRPAFHLPHGIDSEQAQNDIQHLLRLMPVIKQIYGNLMNASYWINVGLESGVFMTYPGHGRFPMMYDHRDQDWYRLAARQGDQCSWDSPAVDPASRAIITTVAYPIINNKGDFLGAASIDVPIADVMRDSDLRQEWGGDVRSFMLLRAPREDGTGDGLAVIARQYFEDGVRRHWMTGIEQEWLESNDEQGFRKLLASMKESSSGVVRLPYKGVDSVWAFASNPDVSFMLIAPESVVAQLPNEMANSLKGLFAEVRDISAIIGGIMLLITGLIAWFGSRTITRPLISIANAARRLAGGDFSTRITMKTGDERDSLIESFNEMGPKLEEHMRISKDLELAHEVQRMLMPTKKPDFPGYDISGGIEYCDQTGGDYYDFIDVYSEEGRFLGVVLGDVSGHGVPSALVMATARGQLHSLSWVPMGADERMQAINSFLSYDLDGTGRFITMFYLRLEEGSDTIHWVRAGHDPAIRYTPGRDEFSELGGDGLALGVLEDYKFESYEDTLTTGEILVMATDGVWEARSSEGEMYGKERMLAIIRDNAHKSAEDIRLSIMKAVSEYQGNGQEDDIAVVVVKKA